MARDSPSRDAAGRPRCRSSSWTHSRSDLMAGPNMTDPVALARELIRRPSVTPADCGAMGIVETALAELGFACRRMKFGDIENLYARRGTAHPNLCFAGHTDVVPPGDVAAWSHGPFEGEIAGGALHGRGAADMKSAI